jgi:hypothetical protein
MAAGKHIVEENELRKKKKNSTTGKQVINSLS